MYEDYSTEPLKGDERGVKNVNAFAFSRKKVCITARNFVLRNRQGNTKCLGGNFKNKRTQNN